MCARGTTFPGCGLRVCARSFSSFLCAQAGKRTSSGAESELARARERERVSEGDKAEDKDKINQSLREKERERK